MFQLLFQNRTRFQTLLIAAALGLVWWTSAAVAWGRDAQDFSALVAKVDPSVVTIKIGDSSEGSGFVVDGKGVILTNYHVIEGAKTATVYFPDKRACAVVGFLGFSPSKDLALLQINPGAKSISALSFAANVPAKGERVFAFGSPMGLSGSVSDGIVAAVRSGNEVRETLRNLAHRDIYKEMLGYDLAAEWIQTTAPISPGNSGGPLVNSSGEVVGINTWVCREGQNLNFSLSAAYAKQLMIAVGAPVQPLASLPPPRPNHGDQNKGDVQATMNAWTQLNEWKAALNEKNLSLEKKVQQVVPIDSRNPLKGSNGRYKRKASLFEQMAKAFADYVSKVKSIETANLDPEVALLTVAEADTAQRVSDACRHLSNISAAQSEDGLSEGEARLNRLKRDLANLRTARDVLRVKLNRRYDKSFPALEDGAGDARSSAINDEPAGDRLPAGDDEFSKGNAAGRDQGAVAPDRADNASPAAAKRSESRVWTDRSGQHQIQAKFLGIEDDKAKLEKPDGKVIFVPLDSLSEADQRFIGVAQ